MIEIALSLAVIGFALIAIIGVLPLGMNVQRENREETIVNQDASLLMEAIRSGAQGMDDLTNYVLVITNAWTDYNVRKQPIDSRVYGYTPTNSDPPSLEFPLTNGFRIIGLLSTPKYINGQDGSYRSNFIVAHIRAFSGTLNEKSPQDNVAARDMGLTYRMVSEITTFGSPVSGSVTNNAWDSSWVNYAAYSNNPVEFNSRYNYSLYSGQLSSLHDIRLLFRWPVLPGGKIANTGRQVYRSSVSGTLIKTNELKQGQAVPLYFIESRTYNTNSL
jgi:type II secretory pathway pseudopilin PulG